MKNGLSRLLTVTGALIALFFLLFDWVGVGKRGIQAAQIFGMEIGALIALCGVAVNIYWRKRLADPSPASFWARLNNSLYDLPGVFWVGIGILPVFVPTLVSRLFFDPDLRIRYLEGYVPKLVPIGIDLRLLLASLHAWFENGQTTQFVFAPLTTILMSPLLLLSDSDAYRFMVIATLTSFLILTLLALLMSEDRSHPVIVFIASISIFSYGMQFELERGQSHTLALMLCVLAIYIFHKHRDYRLFAYLLYCVSVQLKFYPALFVVMFVDDWRDWKGILKRFVGLGLVNVLALFLLGFSYFSDFLRLLLASSQDGELSIGNHSIRSFVETLSQTGIGLFNGSALGWLHNHTGSIQTALYVYFAICFLIVLIASWQRNKSGVNADLLLVCVIGAMVLPSVNHDYTLPLLAIPFALCVSGWQGEEYPWPRTFTILFTILASFTYSLTLFPIDYKPEYLQNSLPMLFIILTMAVIQNVVQRKRPTQENNLNVTTP